MDYATTSGDLFTLPRRPLGRDDLRDAVSASAAQQSQGVLLSADQRAAVVLVGHAPGVMYNR